MADLYYFPLMAGDWLSGEAVSMMTPEQEGAFIHLLCHAWQSKELPCSLPNDDKALAQLSRLGDRWETEGRLVREQFIAVGKGKARLRNPKLWAVFQEFQGKHARRVASGRTGGKAKAKAKQFSSNARPMVEQSSSSQNHNHNQNQTEEAKPTTARVRARLLEADWASFDDLLSRVPNPETWSAELDAMLEGMAGHVRATREQIGRGIRDMVANGKHVSPNLRQLRRYVEGAQEVKPAKPPQPVIERAEWHYAIYARHGLGKPRTTEQMQELIARVVEAEGIADVPHFKRELSAVKPSTWFSNASEFTKQKDLSRIAAAIAPLQQPAAA